MLQGRKMNKLVNCISNFSICSRGTQARKNLAEERRITLSLLRPYAFMYSFCSRYLSPLSAAPLVALVGFGLYELGFPSVSFDNYVSIRYSFKDICSCLNSKYPGCQMCWDWSTWTNPSGDLCNGMIGFLYTCLLHPICSLTLYMSSNYHFPFCSIFAVPAAYCSRAEVYLWPICCTVHYPHSVALCIPSHCWRSIQECTTKDSISLPHWPFWINWWRTLVLFTVLEIQLFICHHHCCQNIWLV